MTFTQSSTPADRIDVVIVGAGFSGLYMLHRLRGLGMTARVIERAHGVGGTWYWNRYPGARCDIESLDYCYSFDEDLVQEWRWSERYATQPEILRYLEHVADRFDLRRDITFGTSVVAADWDESRNVWMLRCDTGETVTATYCVMATGCLSTTKKPDFPGLSTFRGQWYHTGQWPHEPVDFSGKTVAVVGTGSSAIQAIPQIAKQAERLYVLQRTPNYSMPAQNRLLSADEVREALRDFRERRRLCEESEAGTPLAPPTLATYEVPPEQRSARYEEGWRRGGISSLSFAFTDFFTDEEANRQAQDFARAKIRQIVRDPKVAELLCPRHHIGTKRTCTDIGYFETYNRDNVELVDVRDNPIQEITPTGIRLSVRTIDVDVIVFAIGFDAMTGALTEIAIRGVDGQALQDKWTHGPLTLLGLQTAGFPNLFMITGPGSPSVLSNMVVSIEQHVDWVADCLAYLRDRGVDRIEATVEAEERWMRHVAELAAGTLYPRANSWYVGANIPGKPRVFMPYVAGCGQYRRECEEIVNSGYTGFVLGETAELHNEEVNA
ncbi:NAD(P)/FAD-dependent oxidoreductase [Planosporangium thailandense]|uniref:NAD(P)/FAD-dependent oxidoreductase n=1 Tax=Planosporangium thailandense TaxID=765197 RepID=A0ABX0Y704_9ACTN|nr:NAD(P)/FAD-dependent oxidoreductase [Planosporangium thailandense]NJC73069.1 NAD(P)/FAD-dependent oxidoreductase [Planosporangium thailandense]